MKTGKECHTLRELRCPPEALLQFLPPSSLSVRRPRSSRASQCAASVPPPVSRRHSCPETDLLVKSASGQDGEVYIARLDDVLCGFNSGHNTRNRDQTRHGFKHIKKCFRSFAGIICQCWIPKGIIDIIFWLSGRCLMQKQRGQ